MKRKQACLWTWALIFALALTACSESQDPENKIASFAKNIMTINYKVMVGYDDNKDLIAIEGIIEETFDEVNDVYNNWNPNSELSKLNSLPANKIVILSDGLAELLRRSGEMVEISQGLFDPTIAPIHKLWKDALKKGRKPEQSAINTLSAATGWDKVHLDGKTFYKDHDDTTIDLGGIAKGLAVDLIVERLNDTGFPNTYVEWGGEIRCSGEHPSGRPWRIFLSHLGDPDPSHAIATLNMNDKAIAASGDYWQSWTVEGGNTYSHIVNPISKEALAVTEDSIASVNVLAPTCALADGLATAGMLFTTKEELAEWELKVQAQIPEVKFWASTRKDSYNKNKETAQ